METAPSITSRLNPSVDAPARAGSAEVRLEREDDATRIVLTGDWRHATVGDIDVRMREIARESGKSAVIDMGGITHIDTAGVWLVRRLQGDLAAAGCDVAIDGADDSESVLMEAVPQKLPEAQSPRKRASIFERIFAPVGARVLDLWGDIVASMYILGSAVRGAQLKLNRTSGASPAAIVSQMDHMGVRAVPIIALMSFLIGAIITQQSAFQLRYFGAEIFVVDLVGILQLREVGVLLTAIMIAGRSGSAITAEIGSMKMREEIDALKVMGLNPIGVLVFPRLIALVIVLPLLTVVADAAALFGSAVVAFSYSGITPDVFLNRLQSSVDMSTIISGMLKAPFMALIIGIVAAVEGMKVGGSAESLGQHVTASVVKAIFVVILVDGLFAIFYAAINY
ncbi:MlaE family lipid ABC transporter permease subunit [Pararhizobium mangrovi]|uniref:MlaE family lipid ABC transporter permease subunit n=1 Tax=Pararhizobium mangrovi TaxID=2590452 RepID=A0A506U740_9HYPH|nr:MlaE family lipid ABC transporter permease subunit [Pararhizobium mangrovi]TPW29318.1 MlaE family lipid ABC transporter permease subunit [Pararhizobium mangrovi]